MPDPFRIASLPLGHGTLALCPLPRTPDDLQQITRFAPSRMISLTQEAERITLGAATLPDQIRKAGIHWHPFPVPDFGTPPTTANWQPIATAAHQTLANGGRVLAQCRGGLGRSGMVLLRLMIEAGEDPDDALHRLRSARPGAVETTAQENWAHSV